MTGKLLSNRLKSYLQTTPSLSSMEIVIFDSNVERGLPFISVGYDVEEATIATYNHYKVNGFVKLRANGYDDPNNEADGTLSKLLSALTDGPKLSALETNKLKVHALFIDSVDTSFEEHSNEYSINFSAYTYYQI